MDRFGSDQIVSAFLSAGNVKFLLLHDGRNEDTIRNFFVEVHEIYVKVEQRVFSLHARALKYFLPHRISLML